jgi:hypothetical protein
VTGATVLRPVMNALTDALGVRDIRCGDAAENLADRQESKMESCLGDAHVFIQLPEAVSVADAAECAGGDAKLLAGGRA